MFDIGFAELIAIGIVALVVIGPERLPKVARTAGHVLGRLQRYVSDVKADISREMQLDELKKLQVEMKDSVRELESTLHSEMRAVEESVERTAQSARAAIDDLSASVSAATTPADAPGAESLAAPSNAETAAQNAAASAAFVASGNSTIGEGNTPIDDAPAEPATGEPQAPAKARST